MKKLGYLFMYIIECFVVTARPTRSAGRRIRTNWFEIQQVGWQMPVGCAVHLRWETRCSCYMVHPKRNKHLFSSGGVQCRLGSFWNRYFHFECRL